MKKFIYMESGSLLPKRQMGIWHSIISFVVLITISLAACTPSIPTQETGPTPTAVIAGESGDAGSGCDRTATQANDRAVPIRPSHPRSRTGIGMASAALSHPVGRLRLRSFLFCPAHRCRSTSTGRWQIIVMEVCSSRPISSTPVWILMPMKAHPSWQPDLVRWFPPIGASIRKHPAIRAIRMGRRLSCATILVTKDKLFTRCMPT